MFENLLRSSGFWSHTGPLSDIVISTRIRLARNQADASFPLMQDESESNKIKKIASDFALHSNYHHDIDYYDMQDLSELDRRFLRERNTISHELEVGRKGALIRETHDNFTIMINEKDHFKIQVIRAGMVIHETYRYINTIDDELNKFATYAFSSKFGFLTSEIENVGTGLKVSVLMHLPVLTLTKGLSEVLKMIDEIGGVMIPVAEETKNFGSLYIVSNKKALGVSEIDILEKIDEVVATVVEMETEARDDYVSNYKEQVEDRVWRSFGLLKYARTISYAESIEYLSNVRLGIILSMIKDISLMQVNDLMVKIQSAHLQKFVGYEFLTPIECDNYRAEFLKQHF